MEIELKTKTNPNGHKEVAVWVRFGFQLGLRQWEALITRALRALVGVGLSLDPEGRKGKLVRTGCWHFVGADNNFNRKFPSIFNTFFFSVLGPEIMFFNF